MNIKKVIGISSLVIGCSTAGIITGFVVRPSSLHVKLEAGTNCSPDPVPELRSLSTQHNISEYPNLLVETWDAICWKESKNNIKAYNKEEDAKGIVQIKPIMIRDVNKILGKETYTHNDAYDPVKSFIMFLIYQEHYYPNGNPEIWSRAWNGGPTGPYKKSTKEYWQDIKERMKNEGRTQKIN